MKVLDSYALLAWLQGEAPASSTVRRLLDDAASGDEELVMSPVNAGEVYYVVAKVHGRSKATDIRAKMLKLPVDFVSVTDELVWSAAELKADYPMAYADGFAAALALNNDATLITGDEEFEPLVEGEALDVLWL